MTRDYSQFMPLAGASAARPKERSLLERLGWQPFFSQQTSIDEIEHDPPVRVVAVHRSGLVVRGDGTEAHIPPGPEATVGDWLMLNQDLPARSRVLERKSLFTRRAPGTDRQIQKIAANVDTVFLVTSCNQDFNIARIERYLALAFAANVAPVIVLTKADLCEAVAPYLEAARVIAKQVPVLALNACSDEPMARLAAWCGAGQTVAFLGSSGVGKSTLVNALLGEDQVETASIREDDSKGRHTTTARHLLLASHGFAVLDTPGMRELQMAEQSDGIAQVFRDLEELAAQCRFSDCSHSAEPGCAIQAAIAAGAMDPARLTRWRKLAAEERFNSASLAERRADDRAFAKRVRKAMKAKKDRQ